jgi:N-sulfoglucosamine sulfohydrolase
MTHPNILYIHSHDTGRYIRPFGHNATTPNLQRLAEDGVLFRNNFCVGPTCSPSRSALLTGMYPHHNGMFGLAHRGFRLNDYGDHLIHRLKPQGYRTALSGIQHIAHAYEDASGNTVEPWQTIGYDECLGGAQNAHTQAVEWLEGYSHNPSAPFFLSVGFVETHREFPALTANDPEDPRYTLPPAPLADTPETRRDMAEFHKAVRILDEKMGAVFNALDRFGLADNTLVVCTTDHGIAFPRMKCNLHDSGTGTFMIIRGPKVGDGSLFRGGRVVDAMTTHMDVFPTVLDLVGLPKPDTLDGTSLVPLLRGDVSTLHDAVFSEVTYHAAYEPMRGVRTSRYKYIRRFDGRLRPVVPNVDDGYTKRRWLDWGWASTRPEEEMLYDLALDPNEQSNRIGDPAMDAVAAEMRHRLDAWMRETEDPLLQGFVVPPAGAHVTWADSPQPNRHIAAVGP